MRRELQLIPVVLATLLVGGSPWSWSQEEAPPAAAPDRPLEADAAKDMFELALRSYQEARELKNAERQKESFLAAIRQFDRFQASFPEHPNAIKSWYYSAVCYEKVGNQKQYRSCLIQVVKIGKEGALVGAAAYQLALDYYERKNYGLAERMFKVAAAETESEQFRHRSLYIRALCFEKLEKQEETIAALKAILADEGSPYQLQAERVLAHAYQKADMPEEALAHFIHLANAEDPKTKADAILQCAQLARQLGKKEFSRKYSEQILITPALEDWRGEAQLSLMSEAALAGNHKEVITYYQKGDFPLDEELTARRIQIAATAYEAIGDTEQSTALFKKLAEMAPDSTTAFEAGYIVLSREYQTSSRSLVPQATEFLRRYAGEHPDDARVHNARLMLAEGQYKAGQFAPAAQAYREIDPTHIATENHSGLRYRLASALFKAGMTTEAQAAFNVFIEKHPGHPQVASAIVKRAEIFLEQRDRPNAQSELDRLLAHTEKPELREYAWAQKAILHKETIDATKDDQVRADNLGQFANCHTRLLAEFPDRDPKKLAASEFWLGWALYRQNKFAECLKPFQRARQSDQSELGRGATLHLALAYYHLQRQEDLKSELDALLKNYPSESVPRPVFAWLGTSFALQEKHVEAWAYLKHAITPQKPTDTKVVVWRAAGKSALEAGAYQAALRPLEIVLQVEDSEFRKAETHFFLGRAHLALKDTERARKATEACLALKPQGILNPKARLLLGDIAMAQGDPNTAAQYYVPVVELYSKDPSIARIALRKAITALELKGTPASLDSAKGYRTRLDRLKNTSSAPSRD